MQEEQTPPAAVPPEPQPAAPQMPVPPPPTTPQAPPQPQPPAPKSKKAMVVVLLLVVVVLVAAAAYLVTRPKKTTPKPASPTITSKAPTAVNSSTVSITSTGFTPATIKIKAGDQVIWKNTDKAQHRITADPYPTKSSLPTLDSQEPLNQNETFGYTFEKKGTYTYNDYLNHYTFHGTVIVE